jgi:hypothetical protein
MQGNEPPGIEAEYDPLVAVVAVALPPVHLMLTAAPGIASPVATTPVRVRVGVTGVVVDVLPEPPQLASNAVAPSPASSASAPQLLLDTLWAMMILLNV